MPASDAQQTNRVFHVKLPTDASDIGVHVVTAPSWGSQNDGHRLTIRRALITQLDKGAPDSADSAPHIWLNLERRPTQPGSAISISHCRTLGGFAFAQSATTDLQIGFDVEVIARVREDAVLRVSSLNEMKAAPSAAHLWAAKEATFKCLGDLAPHLYLGEIEIADWGSARALQTLPSTNSFHGSLQGHAITSLGFSWLENDHVFAIAYREETRQK